MRVNTGFRREGDYEHYTVSEALPLLEWLLKNVSQTKTKIKARFMDKALRLMVRLSVSSTINLSLV